MAQLNSAGNEALKQADLSSMITMEMVSGVLQGQNFSMPAGYVQEDGARYLVSVGDEFTTMEDIENQLLFNVEGLGDCLLYTSRCV